MMTPNSSTATSEKPDCNLSQSSELSLVCTVKTGLFYIQLITDEKLQAGGYNLDSDG